MNIFDTDKKYIAHTYNRFPIAIKSGIGSEVYSDDDKRYIDMGSGIGVTAFGIADIEWQMAVTEQLGKVQHMSNLYYTEPCALLAKELCKRTGFSKVFFGNSGAEANECAIKVARKYSQQKKGEEYFEIITLENSFHGRTITTLAATGQEHYHELFKPLTNGFYHTPANDLAKAIETIEQHKTAAVMVECIQGEGGVIPLEKDFLEGLYNYTKEKDILLIVDEVQTGNGRTGELYSYLNYDIKPDIITTAKGLGGGLPIGAVLLGEKVESVLGFGDHGSTFGGNPVASAGALSIIKRIDDELLEEVREKSKFIFDSLTGAEGIKSVSGMGLMIGIKTEKPAAEVLKKCMEMGVLALTAKDKLRLLPALNIPMDILEEAIEKIKIACR